MEFGGRVVNEKLKRKLGDSYAICTLDNKERDCFGSLSERGDLLTSEALEFLSRLPGVKDVLHKLKLNTSSQGDGTVSVMAIVYSLLLWKQGEHPFIAFCEWILEQFKALLMDERADTPASSGGTCACGACAKMRTSEAHARACAMRNCPPK
jgi:hypothetical protein